MEDDKGVEKLVGNLEINILLFIAIIVIFAWKFITKRNRISNNNNNIIQHKDKGDEKHINVVAGKRKYYKDVHYDTDRGLQKDMRDKIMIKDYQVEGVNKLSVFAIFSGLDGENAPSIGRIHFEELNNDWPNSNIDIHNNNYEMEKKLIKEKIINAHERIDEIICKETEEEGSSLISVYLCKIGGKDFIVISNLGFSRAVIFDGKDRNGKLLNKIHKANDPKEKLRIEKNGGRIEYGRINGELALSRSFGLNKYKKANLITAKPNISFYERSNEDQFLIVGNGIWNYINDETVVDLVLNSNRENNSAEELLTYISEGMLNEDNLSCIVIFF